MHFDGNLVKVEQKIKKSLRYKDVKIVFYGRRHIEYLMRIYDVLNMQKRK